MNINKALRKESKKSGIMGACIALALVGVSVMGYNPVQAASVSSVQVGNTQNSAQVSKADALFNKGVVLCQQGHAQEALETWDKLVLQFGNAQNPNIQRDVASALLNKGSLLIKFDHRHQEARAAWDELIRRFGKTQNPLIQQIVAWARGALAKLPQ
ncbi:MAG: hypothetical protein J6P47_01705 [Acetobacter sp.]|nr:hypothetical protein [Acetobacter sp.]MBO6085572.1 hypothetical protein [Acetobacter sp.]MBO6090988.1 hypothetical protein [Acetobacter sp.]MBO7073182.1 hypothetical protein [Acetobacter sp.]MBO7350161.1 hypothetical protein [Acetobacter sp.]